MSRLVFRNRTGYPDDDVADLVRFAASDLDLPSRFSIVVRVSYIRLSKRRRANGDGKYLYAASGRAKDSVRVARDVPENAAFEVFLRIGRPEDFPLPWYDRRGREPLGELEDWEEALVAIAAHELRHISEFQTNPRWREQTTGPEREARCDAYAARVLRLYRQIFDVLKTNAD